MLGLGRGAHLRVARESAKPTGTAVTAATRRSGRMTRRRGSGAPERTSGCYDAPTPQQTTPACSSPPGAALGQLHVDETAAEAGNRRRRQELGFQVLAALEATAARARVGRIPVAART
jgi:hypothetical protein